MTKTCKNLDCPETNPQSLDNFFNDKGFKSGKMATCKTCKQAKTMKWRETNKPIYNDYMKEWRAKNPDKQHDPSKKRGRLYVDHDHSNGKVRGLLRGHCNSAIGYFDDQQELLLKAIEYLKGSK
jgi:hypothetical protein